MQSYACHLCVQEWERLHAAFWDMKTYWNMLEWKRIQLENEEKDQKMVQDARTTLTQNIRHIQLDLRDLISQVSTQVSTVFLLKSTHISSFPFLVAPKMVWYKICFAFSSRWALWEALGKGQQLLWHKHPWTQQAGPGQYGTAEWKVTSSWGIWTFTSQSWQETFFYWLRKYSHDSKLKKRQHTQTHTRTKSKRKKEEIVELTLSTLIKLERLWYFSFKCFY